MCDRNRNGNIEYYNENAEEFYQTSVEADMSLWRDQFLKYIPDGGRILDAGCGSGRDSKVFLMRGYSVVAIDASREMCKKASELLGQEVWQMKFEEMSFDDEFDGAWACASLLHVPGEAMEDVLRRIRKGLQQGGFFYASFKYGEGETKKGERFFTNYTEESVAGLFRSNGFRVLECATSMDVRPGREGEKWINIIGVK